MWVASSASAQAPDADETPEEAQVTPSPEAAPRTDTERPSTERRLETMPGLYPENLAIIDGKGIWIGTPDRSFTFRMSGFVHLDTRFGFTDDDDQDAERNIFWRRVRLTLDGRAFGDFEYRFMWDLMIDPLMPYDWHLDWRKYPAFNVRIGGFKSPFSLERRGRSYALPFIERGFPTALAPNRDMGVFVYGQSEDGFFSYDIAGVAGAENLGVLTEFRGSPELAGRVHFHPFRLARGLDKLRNFGVGLSWTIGRELGSESDPRLGVIRATPRRSVYGGRMLFQYRNDPSGDPVFAHGRRDRQGVQLLWSHKRVLTLFEYTRAAQTVGRGSEDGEPAQVRTLANHAWQIMGSLTLTRGDKNSFFGVKPSRPFRPSEGQWGGATISARFHEIYIDPRSFPVFADPDVSIRGARAGGLSLQWHIEHYLEVQFDAEVTVPRGGAPGGGNMPIEVAIQTRIEARY